MPKVVFVHDWLTGFRGGEKCLEVLCRHFPDAPLYTLLHRKGSTSPAIERMDIRTSFLQRLPAGSRVYRYLLPLMPRAIESLRLPHDTDVVVSFSHAVAKSVRPPPGAVHICYCMTPMRYVWHLRDDYFGDPSHPTGPLRRWVDRARNATLDRIAQWDRRTSNRVTHFLAASSAVQQRINQCYLRSAQVVFPPVDTDYFRPAPVERESFFLCVSALVPYKRLDLAIAACNRLGQPLRIIGDGPERRRLQRLAGPTVELLGRLPDAAVRDHYQRCRALLFPGLEDFGIVPVEAQACGAPVIAFARGGACETVSDAPGRETGFFFHEQTTDSLIEAMHEFAQREGDLRREHARNNALTFGTERFEDQLVRAVHTAADRNAAFAGPRQPSVEGADGHRHPASSTLVPHG